MSAPSTPQPEAATNVVTPERRAEVKQWLLQQRTSYMYSKEFEQRQDPQRFSAEVLQIHAELMRTDPQYALQARTPPLRDWHRSDRVAH